MLPDRPLTRTVLRISTPAVAGLSFQVLVSVSETAMIGRLEGATIALAALGVSVLASWAITSFLSSLATGTHVLVARRSGQQDHVGAGDVLNNSLLLSLILGIVVGVGGYYLSALFIGLFTSEEAVTIAATPYLQWRFVGLAFFLFVVSYRGFFNGIGHTHVFLISAIFINLSNILLNYVFIFGAFGFPAMGLDGAGLAYAVSNVIGCFFFVAATFSTPYRTTYRYYSSFSVRRSIIESIVRISTPVSFQNIMILLGFLVFVGIAGILGTEAQAASQVVTSALFISFLPCFGFGIGAQTLVGQSMGTGKMILARRYGVEAARLATYFTTLLGVIFIATPDLVVGMITTNAEVAAQARPILQLAGAAQVFYASGIVLAHALQAAGATVYVMLIEVLTHWVLFLPLSYIVGVWLGFGLLGAWLGLPLYILAYSGLIIARYRSGTWMHIKV